MATRWWTFCTQCDERLSRHMTEELAVKAGKRHAKTRLEDFHEPGHICVPQPVEVPDDSPPDDE